MKITITDFIDNNHRSHYWYGGECAKIEYKGYTFALKSVGDVYVEYAPNGKCECSVKDKNNAGIFYREMSSYIKNDEELYEAIDNGDLIVDYNNWWECFVVDKNGEFHDLMWALDDDYIDEAIESIKSSVDEIIKHIEEA